MTHDSQTNDSHSSPSAKGRPTPKRKIAEAQRKINSLAPAITREAKLAEREAMRSRRIELRQAFMRGEESALPARDKGPVKRFARNYVDSRFSIGEFFLPIVMAVIVLTLIQNRTIQLIAVLIMYLVMLFSIISGLLLARSIKRAAKERFPDASLRGLGMYAWLRSTQMRRMRAPAPQVKRGEKPSQA